MPILPEGVKKNQPNTNKTNPTTSTYLRYFICSKKPDLGLEHGEDFTRDGRDVTRAGGWSWDWLWAGERPEGEGDSTRPPEPALLPARERARKGWIPVLCLSPESRRSRGGFLRAPNPLRVTLSTAAAQEPGWVPAAPLCSAQPCRAPRAAPGSPERAQRCCHRGRGAGHGAPACPGCQCHWGELLGGHSGTFRLNGRGEVAPARTEQLMVPKPWRGAGRRLRSLLRGHSRKGHEQFAPGGQGQALPGSQDCQNTELWVGRALVAPGSRIPGFPAPAPALSLPW